MRVFMTRGDNEAPRPRTSRHDSADVTAALATVHSRIVEVAHAACVVDIRSYEGLSATEIRRSLAPLAIAHLEESLEAARSLFALCDEWEQKTSPGAADPTSQFASREFDFEIDKLVSEPIDTQSPREQIADIAFIAKSELKDRRQRLAALTDADDRWHLLAEYDSALRRIGKSMAAVEYVLCSAESLPRRLDFQTELDVSLLVRRCYVRFRRSITGPKSPDESSIYRQLRAAGTQIAVLVGRDVYPLLRIRDRAQLRELQERILTWMRDERDNPKAGLRIWQDLVGVVDIFCQVSRRQELVEHDTARVRQIQSALEASAGDLLSDEAISLFEDIEGVDLELDSLLADERRRDPSVWSDTINRLVVQFGLSSPAPTTAFNIVDDEDFF